MNASVNVERNSWRLPPDETVQVADPRSKSAQVKEVNRSSGSPCGPPPNRRILAVDCARQVQTHVPLLYSTGYQSASSYERLDPRQEAN